MARYTEGLYPKNMQMAIKLPLEEFWRELIFYMHEEKMDSFSQAIRTILLDWLKARQDAKRR